MENKKNSKLVTGLFLGVLLGAGATIFLQTKKGKKLLSSAKKEGLDNLSDLKKLLVEDVEEMTPLVDTLPEPKRKLSTKGKKKE